MEQRPKVLDDEKPPTRGSIHHNVEFNGFSKASTVPRRRKNSTKEQREIHQKLVIYCTCNHPDKPSPGGNLHCLVPGL